MGFLQELFKKEEKWLWRRVGVKKQRQMKELFDDSSF